MLRSPTYRHREQTVVILAHIITGVPEAIGPRDVNQIFLRLGLLFQPFHFLVTSAEVHDGRNVLALGGYFKDSIDILVMCPGDAPSQQHQKLLDDLLEALLLDYEQPPAIISIRS